MSKRSKPLGAQSTVNQNADLIAAISSLWRGAKIPAPASESDPFVEAFKAIRVLLGEVRDPVIFDVGAHHGTFSTAMRELVAGATIYAFEPYASSFQKLQAEFKDDLNTRVFNYGLCEADGTRPFHINSNDVTNSLLATDVRAEAVWGKELLETKSLQETLFRTVDSVVAEMQIPKIDLLKLDVQGAEHLVLQGAAKACRDGLIRLIYAEIITSPTYQGQKRFDEALKVYYDAGFDLFRLYNMSFSADGRLRQLDALFTPAVE